MDGFIKKPNDWNKINYKYNNLFNKLDNIKLNKNYDVIYILAGGFNNKGIINKWVKRRLDYFINLYNKNKNNIKYVVCLGGGTYHKPPVLNTEKYVIHESTGLVKYLLDNRIPKNILMREWFSYDTIANGYFSYINFTKIRNWKNILVITSNFHLERSKLIFEWIYSLDNIKYNLDFIGVSDKGFDINIINSRIKREKQSIINLKKVISKINNLEKLHEWFHKEHNCYNCNFNNIQKLDENIKNSY